MNNAASSMISAAGRTPAPARRQQSSRSDSGSDFLRTVKKAVDSKNKKNDPTAADQKQDPSDDDKKADQPESSSKEESKTETPQNDGSKALEAAMAQAAALVPNQVRNPQAQTLSFVQNQTKGQAQNQTAPISASAGMEVSQTAKALQQQLQAQALKQDQLSQSAPKGMGADGTNGESNRPSGAQGTVVSLKTQTQANDSAKASADGKVKLFVQTAAEDKAVSSTQPAAPETGKTEGRQSEESGKPAQPGDGIRKTEEPSSNKTGENREALSAQSQGMSQEGAETPGLVKIKVGEGPLNPQSKQFPQDVAKTVLHYSRDGKSEFDIQLTPRELGTIHIQLVFDKGTASVLMHCADPKTQNLLSLNSEQIRSIVQGETGLHTTVQLKEDPSSQNGRQDFDGRGQNPQRDAQRQEQQRRNQLDQELFSQQFRMEFQRTGAVSRAF